MSEYQKRMNLLSCQACVHCSTVSTRMSPHKGWKGVRMSYDHAVLNVVVAYIWCWCEMMKLVGALGNAVGLQTQRIAVHGRSFACYRAIVIILDSIRVAILVAGMLSYHI